jgi:N-acetylglucosamine-6-phosphate deacetylase
MLKSKFNSKLKLDKIMASVCKKIPGLVDLQVNGYLGVDFSSKDLTRDTFLNASRAIFKSGTTAFLPTIITSSKSVYKKNLPLIASVMDQKEFQGRILGLHLEGPFICGQKGARGAHNQKLVKKPDINFLKQLMDWSDNKIKLLTVAAGIEGIEKVIEFAARKGIAVSLGHQMANSEDLERAVGAGAMALTHLGNGVPELLPRHNNPIWAGLGNDNLSAMIITDSHHLPPAVVKSIIRTKGINHCIITSDSSPLAGLKPGRYKTLGNNVVLEENGKLHNPTGGHLVGSSSNIFKCMNWLASLDLVSLDDLIKMGFSNPLKLIGVDKKDLAESRKIWFDETRLQFCMEK